MVAKLVICQSIIKEMAQQGIWFKINWVCLSLAATKKALRREPYEGVGNLAIAEDVTAVVGIAIREETSSEGSVIEVLGKNPVTFEIVALIDDVIREIFL